MYAQRGADGYISPVALTRRLRFIPDRWEKGFSKQVQAWGNTATSYFGAAVQLYGKANGIPKYHKAYRKQSLKLSLMHGETSSGFEN